MWSRSAEIKFRNFINLQMYKFFYDFSKFFHSRNDGREKKCWIPFFSTIKIYEENEDKALYMHSARYVDRGQL